MSTLACLVSNSKQTPIWIYGTYRMGFILNGGLQVGLKIVLCNLFTNLKERRKSCAHAKLEFLFYIIIEVEWMRRCA